jgi:CheY-like chemotaxis protein
VTTPKVLLIEDDARARRLVRWTLEDAGLEVAELHDRSRLAEGAAHADVVVLDIVASGSGELTALEELSLLGSSTPRVVFTDYAQPYLRSVAGQLGAAAFVERAENGSQVLTEVVLEVAGTAA